jgi:hypothetical protein
VPAHQECADTEDGYEFLVMHRHMMRALRGAFPQHAALFAGFPTFPTQVKDVPLEWQGRFGTGWSQQVLDTAATLQDIEPPAGKPAMPTMKHMAGLVTGTLNVIVNRA